MHLAGVGYADVASVRGGMQAWIADAQSPCPAAFAGLRKADGRTEPLAARPMSLFEQWAAVVIGFVIKPFYMALALATAIVIRRRRRPELVALRWGLLAFFAGEAFCAVNYLVFGDSSYLSEFLHAYGMALSFGFAAWAAFEGTDRWLIRYSGLKERCAALPLCRQCIKYADVPCGLKRLFHFMIPASIVMAFLPLTAGLSAASYNTEILGTFDNYSHPVIHQVYEIRLLPVAAIVLLAGALAVLLPRGESSVAWSKLLFSAGAGALGFSLLRLAIYAPFEQRQVWYTFWEEITELLFICGVAAILWIFRRGLLAGDEAAAAAQDAASDPPQP